MRTECVDTRKERRRAREKTRREADPSKRKAITKRHYAKNKEMLLAKTRQWRANNKGRVDEARRAWNAAHPENVKAWADATRLKNQARAAEKAANMPSAEERAAENKAKKKERGQLWRDANKAYMKSYGKWHREHNRALLNESHALRRARRLQATPSWADRTQIRAIYRLCNLMQKQTGVEHHVDHIVPLISDIVCGLHTQHNLRIVTGKENIAKGNFLLEDCMLIAATAVDASELPLGKSRYRKRESSMPKNIQPASLHSSLVSKRCASSRLRRRSTSSDQLSLQLPLPTKWPP